MVAEQNRICTAGAVWDTFWREDIAGLVHSDRPMTVVAALSLCSPYLHQPYLPYHYRRA